MIQTWGARHDPGFASPGPVRQRHRPAGRGRPKDRQDIHRQRAGAAGLQEARAGARRCRSLQSYLRERLAAYPILTARRLFGEITERGHSGGYSVVRDRLRDVRPAHSAGYELRFETPPGEQAKSTSPRFEIEFVDEQAVKRIGWLFSMVLGYSRLALGQLRFNAGLPDAAIVFLDAYRRGWT